MSVLNKKNFFEKLSGSRLTRETPRIEVINNGTSIVINNKVKET